MWSRIKAIIAFLSTRELETVPLSHSGDILVTPFWCPVLDIHLRVASWSPGLGHVASSILLHGADEWPHQFTYLTRWSPVGGSVGLLEEVCYHETSKAHAAPVSFLSASCCVSRRESQLFQCCLPAAIMFLPMMVADSKPWNC